MYLTFRLLTFCVFGLIVAPAQGAETPSKLELKLSLSKTEIVQYEPVILKVWVKNVSNKPQQISRGLELIWDDLHIKITNAAGKLFHYGPSVLVDGSPGEELLSADGPENAFQHRIMLFAFPGNWLDTPDKYKLHTTFDYGKTGTKPLTSNTVTLTIKPAKGVNEQALTRLRGYPQSRFLQGSTTDFAIADEFKAVIQKYPQSIYTPWCYYILALADQTRESRPDKQRALAARRNYEQLLKKYPKFPLKTEVKYEMARELLRMGKREEALKQIDDLAGKHPDLLLFRNVNRTLEWYRDNGKEIPVEELPPHYPQ